MWKSKKMDATQKIVLTIHKKDYPIEHYSYTMFKSLNFDLDTVEGISISLELIGRHDLDTIMVDGSFFCTLTVSDGNDRILRQLEFEGTEIVSFSENVSGHSDYTSVQMMARAVQFDGKYVSVKKDWN